MPTRNPTTTALHAAPAPPAPGPDSAEPAALYLGLLREALLGALRAEDHVDVPITRTRLRPLKKALGLAQRYGITVARRRAQPAELLEEGRFWPPELSVGVTMIGRRRLANVQSCVETVLEEGVPGDLIEAGVWRGGAAILMRGVLRAHADTERIVYAADSFEGLPPAATDVDATVRLDASEFAVRLDEVRRNFARFGLLDEQVRFVEGWFSETLPALADRRWAVARIDADLYQSTMDALRHIEPQVSPGGFVIVDDYGAIRACRQAVDEYRSARGIAEPLRHADWTGVYWRKAG